MTMVTAKPVVFEPSAPSPMLFIPHDSGLVEWVRIDTRPGIWAFLHLWYSKDARILAMKIVAQTVPFGRLGKKAATYGISLRRKTWHGNI